MDANLILTRTARGVIEARTEGGKLSYDAVRLLRLVNGKASIGDLRSQFSDLTDMRFQKALTTLEDKKLVRALPSNSPNPGERFELPRLDRQLQELGQEFMQSLDFTTLEHELLKAIRSSPAATAAPATTLMPPVTKKQESAAAAGPEPGTGARPARKTIGAQMREELLPALRLALEEEVRRELTTELRPKIEEELRRQLAVSLRPALEAEIRAKLATALKQRIDMELRDRPEDES